jgi:hypothetical protein
MDSILKQPSETAMKSSLLGLIVRPSIFFEDFLRRRRWMPGSGPGMTSELSRRETPE